MYEWPDLRIVAHVTPDAERPGHLEQFVGWLEDRSKAIGKPLGRKLAARIRSTTIVLGFVVEKTTDPEGWNDRVQDMIGMICINTGFPCDLGTDGLRRELPEAVAAGPVIAGDERPPNGRMV
jgi:hypothetical protein